VRLAHNLAQNRKQRHCVQAGINKSETLTSFKELPVEEMDVGTYTETDPSVHFSVSHKCLSLATLHAHLTFISSVFQQIFNLQ
jgi:hypothetical protein